MELMMATMKVDEIQADERKLVVAALELMAKSAQRAAKATTSEAVRAAFEAEHAKVLAVAAKFR